MNTDQAFTDAINYKLIAQVLIRAGYTYVPKMEAIIVLAAREQDMQLLRWVNRHYQNSLNIFSGMTAFYMQRN